MTIAVRKNNNKLTVLSGNMRLEAQLELNGEAVVSLNNENVTVVKDKNGQLVEKVIIRS